MLWCREVATLQKRLQRAEKQAVSAVTARVDAESKLKDTSAKNGELEGSLKRLKKQTDELIERELKSCRQQVPRSACSRCVDAVGSSSCVVRPVFADHDAV